MKQYLDAVPPRERHPLPFSPGAFDWSGRPYSIAVDGHRAMIVEGHHAPMQDVPVEPMQRWLAPIVTMPCTVGEMVAALRLHAGLRDCQACKNARTVDVPVMMECHECDGEGALECGECGHESDCKHCKGSGQVKSRTTKTEPCACIDAGLPVTLGISQVNLRLLLPVLEQIPDQPIRWGHLGDKYEPLRIDGEGWHFLLMPMRTDEHAPVVELGGAK